MKQFEFSSLRIFVAVAETGSISKAAERVHLAVAATSKRMTDLESTMRARLFSRHSRGVTLTPAGQALYQHARDVLFRVERMHADLGEFARGIRGQVRLAANESVITQFLPRDLKRFAARHPQLAVDLSQSRSIEIVDAVTGGRADIGIFSVETAHTGLIVEPYQSDRLSVIYARRHKLARLRRITLADVLPHDFIGLQEGSALHNLLVRESNNQIRTRIRVGSFDSACRMVEAGLGVSIVPTAAAQPHVDAGNIETAALAEPWAVRQHVLGVRAGGALSAAACALLEFLRAARA